LPVRSLAGLDHVVFVVRDLAASQQLWTDLGFSVSPRGCHPDHMGTANHTIMLGEDYIEIVGILKPTSHNEKSREFLSHHGEGVERVAFTTDDADATAADLKVRNLQVIGPLDFNRPVKLPDGRKSVASFRTLFWPASERPAGMRIFACQHLTRDTVWIPELTRHVNKATRIARMDILTADPMASATHMSRLIGVQSEITVDGFAIVRSGGNRASIVFMDRKGVALKHSNIADISKMSEGCVALSLQVEDFGMISGKSTSRPMPGTSRTVKIAPSDANGVILEFTTDVERL
jgi:catechol 2,3-dioxygenase-like lactoylglutathione lyase family enzyme